MQIFCLIQIGLSTNYSKYCEEKCKNIKMFINPEQANFFIYKQLIIENLNLKDEIHSYIEDMEDQDKLK